MYVYQLKSAYPLHRKTGIQFSVQARLAYQKICLQIYFFVIMMFDGKDCVILYCDIMQVGSSALLNIWDLSKKSRATHGRENFRSRTLISAEEYGETFHAMLSQSEAAVNPCLEIINTALQIFRKGQIRVECL
jgi:hypothetical protein